MSSGKRRVFVFSDDLQKEAVQL